MNTISTADARVHFSEIVNRAAYGQERIVLTRHGKALVAVIPIEDLIELEALEDRLDLHEALISLAEADELGTIPLETVKRELELELESRHEILN